MSSMSSSSTTGVSISSKARGFERAFGKGIPRSCRCGERPIIRPSETVQNPGRLFYCCPNGSNGDNYHLWKWTDVAMVEEMEDVESVVQKLRSDLVKLQRSLTSEMETLASVTRSEGAAASSFGREIEGMKEIIEQQGKEIGELKAKVCSCVNLDEFRSLKQLLLYGIVIILAYYCVFS